MSAEDLPEELNALLQAMSQALSSTASTLSKIPPTAPKGLSLLDLKNHLFLSYIQHLALLILSKLNDPLFSLQNQDSQRIIWQLIQDRVHLEKGVFPLETKIGYQLRKLLRAAEDSSSNAGKDENLRFKPNPSAMITANMEKKADEGVYKPPKISSTLLPTANAKTGPRRNKVLQEFISSSDLNAVPTAIPSIGSNLTGIGQRNMYKTARNKDVETYEEENFIRLPAHIGREKKRGKQERNRVTMEFGGEDWSGLERIGKGSWEFGKRESKLERSRKRHVEDNPGSEDITGQAFEKRKKLLRDRKLKKHRKM